MRPLLGILLASIASLSYSASLEAPVYIFDPSGRPSRSDLSITPETARLIFAQRLGVTQYHSLKHEDEEILRILNKYGSREGKLFCDEDGSHDRHGKLLVVVESVEHPEDIFDASPVFTISNIPSSPANLMLVEDFLAQDRHRRGATQHCDPTTLNADTIRGGHSKSDPFGTCLVEPHAKSLKGGSDPFSELMLLPDMLNGLINIPIDLEGATSIFHIGSLEAIARQDGVAGEKYSIAARTLKLALNTLANDSSNRERTFILVPPAPKYTKRISNSYGSYEVPSKAGLNRRQQTEDPLTLSAPEGPLTSSPSRPSKKPQTSKTTLKQTLIPLCFSTVEACNAGTNNCSGHGNCFRKYTNKEEKLPVDCFTCNCGNSTRTSSDGKLKTTQWGGAACQKKDVSMPFFLIAGTTIAIVALVSWGIGLLFSIGQEDLPSVIGAGVAGPRAQK